MKNSSWNYFLNPPISPITLLENEAWQQKGVQVFMKRDDLLCIPSHPEVCGNKWRKLWGTFSNYNQNTSVPLITQGGLHSNHLIALAAAGHFLGVQTVGIVRGENNMGSSPTLQKAMEYGMELHFISRNHYKNLPEIKPLFLYERYGNYIFIPEGGSNEYSPLGLGILMNEIENQWKILPSAPTTIAVPVATSGTINGLNVYNKKFDLLGIYVLKGFEDKFLATKIIYNHFYHLGGYAKFHLGLVEFIHTFFEKYQIILDPIYTGKLMFGINDLILNNHFKPGTNIIAIHTGGLQGIEGFNKRYQIHLPLPT